jgi:hypothetical protein
VKHSYPRDLAKVLLRQWESVPASMTGDKSVAGSGSDSLPDSEVLEYLISVCYQASLLRDEERPVRFRLLLRAPDRLDARQGPPEGLHRVAFTEHLSLDEEELRRLSIAADFYRSLIGAQLEEGRGLRIWGLVNSGPRWLHEVHGGRKISELLPPALVIRVTGPGRIAVCKGSVTIATLNSGRIALPWLGLMASRWLMTSFTPTGDRLFELHREVRLREGAGWAELDPAFIRILTRQVYRRVISIVRNSHHGGTIILVPPERANEVLSENPYIDIKYKFVDEESRHRLEDLYLHLMNALAEDCGRRGLLDRPAGWNDYVSNDNNAIERLDKAIFETAHFIADLAAMDGAVVMTKALDLLGFGGEILSGSHKIETVARALDAEGDQVQMESTRGVGTRHRSAYRLCNELHDAIAVVISQDGAVRVVIWKDSMVIYWDQVVMSVLDI